MTRRVFLLDLVDDTAAIARYEAWHRAGAVPAAVVASIRRAGIGNMEIYRSGNRLVMVMDTDASFDPAAKSAADAVDVHVVAWERLMDEFQRPLAWADHGAKWTEAARIFDLTAQP